MVSGTKDQILTLVEVPRSFTELKHETGVTDRAVLQHLRDLREAGLVTQIEEHGPWSLTPKGIEKLSQLREAQPALDRIQKKQVIDAYAKEMLAVVHELGYLEGFYEDTGLFSKIWKTKQSIERKVALNRLKLELEIFLSLVDNIFPHQQEKVRDLPVITTGNYVSDFLRVLGHGLEIMEKIRKEKPEARETIDAAASYLEIARIELQKLKKD